MADAIPDGITREDVLQAIQDLDAGTPNGFRESTGYDVLYQQRRYAPKAVFGLAARRAAGRTLGPYDFKGGRGSRCFRVLEALGFSIVTKANEEPFPEQLAPDVVYWEGARESVLVNKYERNPAARLACIRHFGPRCQVCDLVFSERYGQLGEGFIHVHHLIPLGDVRVGYEVDPLNDLRPVCPNCHAMLHKRRPPFSIDELRDLLRPGTT